MKARLTIPLFCSYLLYSLPGLAAAAANPASIALPPEVSAYVHCGAPKVLSQQIMSVARKIIPGHQTEFFPMMMLGFLGYPEFPGISQKDPMGLFLFEEEKGIAPILVVKMDQGSPLRKTLPAMGWSIQDANGWSFIAPDIKILTDFCGSANQKAMIAATAASLSDDLECIVPDSSLAQSKPKRWLACAPLGNASVWGEVWGHRMRNLKYVWMGLSFKETSIDLNLRTLARPRTPEATLLSQSVGGAVPSAQFFSTQSALVWVVKGDPKVKWDYIQGLFKEVRPSLPVDKQSVLDHWQRTLSDYFKYSDGTQAGALDMRANVPVVQIAHGGSWTPEVFMTLLKTYEMSWPELMAAWAPNTGAASGSSFKFTGRLKPDDFMVSKTPVHLISLEAEWTQPETGLATERWAVAYNALYNGTIIQTNQGDVMKGVLGRFMAGKPVMYSADKAMPLAAGTIARARWDLVRYTSESVGDMLREQAPEVADSLQRLKSEQLDPIEMNVQVGQAQAQFHMSIPVSTLQKIGSIDDVLTPAAPQPGALPSESSPTIPVPQAPGIPNPAPNPV